MRLKSLAKSLINFIVGYTYTRRIQLAEITCTEIIARLQHALAIEKDHIKEQEHKVTIPYIENLLFYPKILPENPLKPLRLKLSHGCANIGRINTIKHIKVAGNIRKFIIILIKI